MSNYLLRELADGAFHSGERLAQRLGISRAAIWKAVQRLETLGIQVESVRGRGYRVPGGLDLLDADWIGQALSVAARDRFGAPVLLVETESTNLEAMRAVAGGLPAYACIAERQLAGRGRLGRSWESPFAANVYLSAIYRQDAGTHGFEGLSLVVGLACADALDACGVQGVGLKWPNDLLADGRKLGGILLELSGDLSGPSAAVIGIGINVRMNRQQGAAIDQPWVSLAELVDEPCSRNRLIVAVLDALAARLTEFEQTGFAGMLQQWRDYDVCADGREVELSTGETCLRGIYRGINAGGGVCLERDGALQVYYGGELSLRGYQ